MEHEDTSVRLDPFRAAPIAVYDVGARGALPAPWHAWAQSGHPGAAFVLFEPHGPAAAGLRETYRGRPQVRVVEAGLWSREGRFTLHVTRHETCSSLLEPDPGRLARYRIAPIFEVAERVPVACARMDGIVRRMALPRPDVCKLDVQGAEYEILLGMGALLDTCLALGLEAHLYPIYKGQRLLSDIVSLLDRHGFTLRDLRPQRHFDADYVEVNSWFAKREDLVPPERAARLDLVKAALGLRTWPAGAEIAAGLEPLRTAGRSL